MKRLHHGKCATNQPLPGGANCIICGADPTTAGIAGDSPPPGRSAAPPARAGGSGPSSRNVGNHLARLLADLKKDQSAREPERKSWKASIRLVGVGLALLAAGLAWRAGMSWTERAALHGRIDGDVRQLAEQIERQRLKTGLYPDAALWQDWTKTAVSPVLDPWRRPYLYRLESMAFSLATYGADGTPGGSGEDEDLTFVFRYTKTGAALLP